jgi:hypothetical protein
MKLLSYTFLGLSALLLLATLAIGGWSGCEQLVEPRVYRGEGRPADVVLFAKAYPPDGVPQKVRFAHSYAWIPLLALTIGCFKAAGYFDAKQKTPSALPAK